MDVTLGLESVTVHITREKAAQARDFYGRVLGFREARWDEADVRGVWLLPDGNTLIAHVMREGEQGRPPGTVSGVQLKCADFAASVAEIKKRGGRITDEPWTAPWGPTYAVVADPGGNEFVLIRRL